MKNRSLLFVTIIISICMQSCIKYKPQFKGMSLTKNTSVSDADFNKDSLNSFTQYLKNNVATTGMVVLYDGEVVYEYGDIKQVSYLASCRKSVLSMLYGKHVADGTIDLQQDIGSIGVDEEDGLLPIEKKATVDHLITARSGVFYKPANKGYDEKNILKRGSVKPGEYFVYNNWDFNVAGHILEHKTGNSIYQELENQLAIPLEFQDWNIKNQKKKYSRKKSKYPAYHMYLSTRDMAKIGQLMLNEGEWKGKQLIPKDWIQKTTTTVTPKEIVNKRNGGDDSSPIQFSYGYMWWLFEELNANPDMEGAYSASGYGGQYITVVPKRKLVIAHKTKVDLLTLAGIRYKGTTDWQYWQLLDKFLRMSKG